MMHYIKYINNHIMTISKYNNINKCIGDQTLFLCVCGCLCARVSVGMLVFGCV